MTKAKMGWHGQKVRHSRAAKFGKAGGRYSSMSYDPKTFQEETAVPTKDNYRTSFMQNGKNKSDFKYYPLKKDSDGDGVPDKKDCAPNDPNRQGTNEQVAEAFARGRKDSSGTMTSKGDSVYSYAAPIAVRKPDGTILFNKRKYSQTTTRHQNLIKRELQGQEVVETDEETVQKEIDSSR